MIATADIPAVPLDKLTVRASFDYIKIWSEFHLGEAIPEDARHQWTPLGPGQGFRLTLHDPDLKELAGWDREPELSNWMLLDGFEVAVDFWPRLGEDSAERRDVLDTTYRALAARFRPEDKLQFGAGFRASFSSPWPKPFNGRLPRPGESLVYGHRGEQHQAKLYLKQVDQGRRLPAHEHRVRLETTLSQSAGRAYPFIDGREALLHVRDFARLGLRNRLAEVFRIIDRPEVRRPSRFSATKLAALEATMRAAWRREGVSAFEAPPLHPEAFMEAQKSRATRDRLHPPLSRRDYKLRRDVATNRAIGNALFVLDRRLRTAFSHI